MSSHLKNIREGIKRHGNMENLQVWYMGTNEVYKMAQSFGLWPVQRSAANFRGQYTGTVATTYPSSHYKHKEKVRPV